MLLYLVLSPADWGEVSPKWTTALAPSDHQWSPVIASDHQWSTVITSDQQWSLVIATTSWLLDYLLEKNQPRDPPQKKSPKQSKTLKLKKTWNATMLKPSPFKNVISPFCFLNCQSMTGHVENVTHKQPPRLKSNQMFSRNHLEAREPNGDVQPSTVQMFEMRHRRDERGFLGCSKNKNKRTELL